MVPSAALPNPIEPGFIAIGGAFGAVVGGTLARALRYAADKKMQWTVEGSYYGSGVALAVYITVNGVGLAVR